jgi:RimJ/RimL family protein N-acetyltransferase
MEIGYWLCPEAEGNGYVTEATKLITQFAFRHLRAERVTVVCDSKNLRSAGVPPRAGFLREATLRNERRNTNGELSDTELFAMTRADFDKQHA